MKIWDESVAWPVRRQQLVRIMCEQEYGFGPLAPDSLEASTLMEDTKYCAGKAALRRISLKSVWNCKDFSFPVDIIVPGRESQVPFFVYISFEDKTPNSYLPVEEIVDNGFGILTFGYNGVTTDDADMDNGIAGLFPGCGKLAYWAWAASRVMDYAQRIPQFDMTRSALAGHSRLGKAALLAGALDERFAYVISNESGCSGAAISRGKQGETIADIYSRFPYWFIPEYGRYAGNENAAPFDQHFLLGSIAPRKLYVASAQGDAWADPAAEYRGCLSASESYEKLGLNGFVHDSETPSVGCVLHEGDIGYHLRRGTHYLSREDWGLFMRFIGS
ncbi:hypothetical protein FACS1894184_14400 [Clostridia bacterium]|nr:hypothetical protein FACS1894184_14400 [Clostridia bacterium]